MYRGIGLTLSSTVSKLFESVLVAIFDDSLQSSELQFGFKKNSSCSHALFTFNESVRYFMKNGSRVHCVTLHCVSKNIPDVFSYNWWKHCQIFIIFGRNIVKKASNQTMLYFFTSPNILVKHGTSALIRLRAIV